MEELIPNWCSDKQTYWSQLAALMVIDRRSELPLKQQIAVDALQTFLNDETNLISISPNMIDGLIYCSYFL